MRVVSIRIVGLQKLVQVFVPVEIGVGELIPDGLNALRWRAELRASGIPAEKIIVGGELPPGGFYKGDAGKEAPIQIVAVSGFEESTGVVLRGAVGLGKEAAERGEPRIVPEIRNG